MTKYKSLQEVRAEIDAGITNCKAIVEYYLSRIKATNELNAYVEVFKKEAIERAELLDKKYRKNPDSVGKLFGMVISIKDVICYKGHQVTGASKILEGFQAVYSATVIERILNEDGIIIGRVNCDQFGMGSTNENSIYGPAKNAADPTKIPGGSSGGSAVSVQADTCLASLGSDTGGSVRQPASFCGVVGFKPTYGRISRYGLLAYASSFDQIGTLTHSVEDAALLLECIAGKDEFDCTVSQRNAENFTLNIPFKRKAKIAYFPAAFGHEMLDDSIRSKGKEVLEKLNSKGHSVEPLDFGLLDYIVPAYYVLTTAEAASNLSRYDGVRFGFRNQTAQNLNELYNKSRTEGFNEEAKRRIMLGNFVLSSGYYDEYYAKAQEVRRLIYEKTLQIFKDYDFIIMPASPVPPWNIGEKKDNPVEVYLADIFTVQANMTGIPAICVPAGNLQNGMPFGMQLMANKFEENKIFSFFRTFGNFLE